MDQPKQLDLKSVHQYVNDNIHTFHTRRIESLKNLSLRKVARNKNPYLFRAKNMLSASDIVKAALDAHLSSNEETIFGDWLEGLAIFINKSALGGWKSSIAGSGIDLEFDHDGFRYLLVLKSGPKWGNSTAQTKLKQIFESAVKTLRTSASGLNAKCYNGCFYGKEYKDFGVYEKICGQRLWELISGGNKELYKEIIQPLGFQAKERNDEFNELLQASLNRLTKDFTIDFCNPDGSINWESLIEYNSSYTKVKMKPIKKTEPVAYSSPVESNIAADPETKL